MLDAPSPQMPRLNEPAPAFDAPTTDGRKTLQDYRGQWLILFSHPADFTPVCTTELGLTSKLRDEFAKRGVKAIAHRAFLLVVEAELVNDALLLVSFVKLHHPRAPCALLEAGKGGLVLTPLD